MMALRGQFKTHGRIAQGRLHMNAPSSPLQHWQIWVGASNAARCRTDHNRLDKYGVAATATTQGKQEEGVACG